MIARLPRSSSLLVLSTFNKSHHAPRPLVLAAYAVTHRTFTSSDAQRWPSRNKAKNVRPAVRESKETGAAVRNVKDVATTEATVSAPSSSDALYKYHVKAALETINNERPSDGINPPTSTVPPPLVLPERQKDQNILVHWYYIGRAYTSFYFDATKAVWYNQQAARALRKRYVAHAGVSSDADAVLRKIITRAEFQLLGRSRYDVGKLPVFGVLVIVFGEWLALLLPFVPAIAPGTARIPSQIASMRRKAEKRRLESFRSGVHEPGITVSDEIQMPDANDSRGVAGDREYRDRLVNRMTSEQLRHISRTLDLHSDVWEFLRLTPPSFLLRRRISHRIAWLTLDDMLLTRHGGAPQLLPSELRTACAERGLDVTDRSDAELRQTLVRWLELQHVDRGRGVAWMPLLFRRPNAFPTARRLAA